MTNQLRALAMAAVMAGCLAAQHPDWMSAAGMHAAERLDGQSGPVLGRPFTATEVRHATQTLADGTHVDRSDTSTFARDDQGRMRTAGDKTILIFDPVAGFNYNVNLRTRACEKAKLPQKLNSVSIAVAGGRSSTSTSSGSGRFEPPQPPKGAVSEDLPPQMMGGLYVKGSRITLTIPAGTFGNDHDVKVVNERWYSDDMQVLVKSTNSDPRFGVTTYELTNIVRTAPDPALFLLPPDCTSK